MTTVSVPQPNPLVSVIVPVHNGAETIAATLDSVRAQTWTHWELLVVDDGSTDGTAALVQQVRDTTGDDRLGVISIPNGGVSAARNLGAARSRGELLTFIDADDLWTPDKLEAQVRMLQCRPGAAVVYSWVDCVAADGQSFMRRGGYSASAGPIQRKMTLIDIVESGSNVMVRRDAFFAVNGFDATLTHGEDWDLWVRLAAQFAYAFVPAPQVLYRQRPASASANVWKMERGSRPIIDRAIAALPPDDRAANDSLRQRCWANRYKILAFEALDGPRDRRRTLAACRYLFEILRRDRQLLQRRLRPLTWALLQKLALSLVLPDRIARRWLRRPPYHDAEKVVLWTIDTRP